MGYTKDFILLGIVALVIYGLVWAQDTPQNTQTTLDILRYKFDGPTSAILIVAFIWVCMKLAKPKRRG